MMSRVNLFEDDQINDVYNTSRDMWGRGHRKTRHNFCCIFSLNRGMTGRLEINTMRNNVNINAVERNEMNAVLTNERTLNEDAQVVLD